MVIIMIIGCIKMNLGVHSSDVLQSEQDGFHHNYYCEIDQKINKQINIKWSGMRLKIKMLLKKEEHQYIR